MVFLGAPEDLNSGLDIGHKYRGADLLKYQTQLAGLQEASTLGKALDVKAPRI
jgi:hypothetical protein